MGDYLETGLTGAGGFLLACPQCHGPLTHSPASAYCAQCDCHYEQRQGIWHFLSTTSAEAYKTFLQQYQRVREHEGWGSDSLDYYRRLPWVAPTDAQHAIWRKRQLHYQAFIARVLEPLEAGNALQGLPATLKILELGAGNGWLSNRLSLRGHTVAAVDINLDPHDGLGVVARYDRPILAVQAEFDHLPFASGQVDLVIFSGSFHYSCDYQATVQEALRTMKSDGLLAILDTPFYDDDHSGWAMVKERNQRFSTGYGFAADSMPSENYLSRQRLGQLAATLSTSWQPLWPVAAWKQKAQKIRSRLRLDRRETAQFPIIVVRPSPLWQMTAMRRVQGRLYESFLRWRYRWLDRPRSQSTQVEKVNGVPILVYPGVFNPRLFRSGQAVAQLLSQRLIPPGCSMLDLGTGTGIAAIVAAQWAGAVVAVDINPDAVACANANVRLHHLERVVQVRQGDLFSSLGSQRFDVVLINPPFLHGTPTNAFERAFFSEDVAERFAAGLSGHLTPGGYALLLLSSMGDTPAYLQALRWQGFQVQQVAERAWVNERFTLYRVLPCRDRTPSPASQTAHLAAGEKR